MIFNLLQLLLVLNIFFGVKYLAWKITDEWEPPLWLRYKPWECYKCLSFWSLTALYLVCGLILQMWIAMGVGLGLTVLDVIAVMIDQKNKTVKINDSSIGFGSERYKEDEVD